MNTPCTCAECGQPVTVQDGEITRTCEHAESGVIASVTATVYGEATAGT